MNSYWQDHSKNCNINEMMLDDNAEKMSDMERDEVMSYLPNCSGKDVLELGAGIG